MKTGRKAAAVGCDGVTFFSPQQAAEALAVSVSTLRNWRQSGRLVPAEVRDSIHIYTAEQIERARRDHGGHLAAEAFKLFELGRTPVQVVIELSAEPEQVARLHRHYVELSGAWVIEGPNGPRARWEAAYQIGELTPAKLRRALELCAVDPKLRSKLLEANA